MAFDIFKKSKPAPKRKARVATVKPTETKVQEVSRPAALTLASNILHPYVSEKATRLESMNQFMFKVTRTANKPEVKKAIQSRYNVSVIAVRMINMPSKSRTVGRHVGTKQGFRKAIVTLKDGDTINAAKA